MTKAISFFLFLFAISLGMQAQNAWIARPNYPGIARNNAVAFAIGTKGYLGTGGTTANGLRRDFWAWDQLTNTWTQIADFGGAARNGAIAFATDGKGYVGTGSNAISWFDDLYEYDPVTNFWIQKADFPGGARAEAIGFGSENPKAGYISTGVNAAVYYNDLWQYNPQTDSWVQKANVPTAGRTSGEGFFLQGKGYITTGSITSIGDLSDLWEWDPQTDIWTQRSSMPVPGRKSSVGFAMNGKGYIATGSAPQLLNDFWEWDPLTDTWTQLPNVGVIYNREEAAGFVIGNSCYVGGGYGWPNNGRLTDFWEYSNTIGIEELPEISITLFPVPATDQLTLTFPSNLTKATITISDVSGKCVYQSEVSGSGIQRINIESLAAGTYVFEMRSEKGFAREKFVKVSN